MINTSAEYKTAIIANERTMYAKLEFEILDVDANTDAIPSVTSELSISKKNQIYNQIREMSGKYATLENNYWKLDGSFSLFPKVSENFEVDWWSNDLSGVGGIFSTSQVITTSFTKDHSSIGITITFDTLSNEYASDFSIVFKDLNNLTIHEETVTGNTLSKYILSQNISNYRSVVITITKWKSANRRARITEIDFGIIQEYTGVELIKMNVLEEIDVISNTISPNEVEFSLDNQDKNFNIINPDGIYAYLQQRQKLRPYIGVLKANSMVEYIPMGVYYLTEWKSDEGTLTASFVGRDILDILEQSKFSEKTYISKTITYIIEDILNGAGIINYNIDIALSSIIVSGTLPESSYKDAIQETLIAGQAVVYSDRYGVLQIKQLNSTSTGITIDYDNVYNSPKIELNKLINTVNVKYGPSNYQATNKTENDPILEVTIDNALITTLSHAQNVANWILTELSKRFNYEINWRQNPSLEAGDLVNIEDDFSEDKQARITKQELNFAGYLSGKTYAKGDGT